MNKTLLVAIREFRQRVRKRGFLLASIATPLILLVIWGLVGGDVIVAWEGQPVTQMEELRALVGESEAGQEVTLTVLRDGEQLRVPVTLEARPTS